MIGAILTQNTAWSNVEKALDKLRENDCLDVQPLIEVDAKRLAIWIRSSGYFNQKANRLKNFADWYCKQGGYEALTARETGELRGDLLAVHGIGDETADDILLYAFHRAIFVIDTYTRRVFSRLNLLSQKGSYRDLQRRFHENLDEEVAMFQQYHALIVEHAKQHCRNKPRCEDCPLALSCHYAKQER
jgi:endonuclease-3 related protein